jgi:hypothetical protein
MNQNERYKNYRNTLIGKQDADQMLKVFKNESDNNKYSNLIMDDEKYWIINITKHLMMPNPYHWHKANPSKIHIGSTFYTLYMHKQKDFVVLKTCILLPRLIGDYANNCSTFFIHFLRKKGFNKYEFTKETQSFDMCKFKLTNIKILIPVDKTEDDLIGLISMIDKFNEMVQETEQTVWDNFKLIKEKIKFEI